jgi:NAD-dependent dihydropyrimidine dehydrogenase PreA subunit
MENANFALIEADLCKGCRLCVETCPRSCLEIGNSINKLGYQNARFATWSCTACGLCFYACPEPGAITVYKSEPVGTLIDSPVAAFSDSVRAKAAGAAPKEARA